MLLLFLGLNLVSLTLVGCEEEYYYDGNDNKDLGKKLANDLKNDANLDLSVDDEYEDLRAEFLAYRSALASLKAPDETPEATQEETPAEVRRSMLSTPCWKLNGICINHKLCKGFSSVSEVPGCKDKLKVCCFVWDRYNVRDWRTFGIDNIAMPWKRQEQFGGLGVIEKTTTEKVKAKNAKPKKSQLKQPKSEVAQRSRVLAYFIIPPRQ